MVFIYSCLRGHLQPGQHRAWPDGMWEWLAWLRLALLAWVHLVSLSVGLHPGWPSFKTLAYHVRACSWRGAGAGTALAGAAAQRSLPLLSCSPVVTMLADFHPRPGLLGVRLLRGNPAAGRTRYGGARRQSMLHEGEQHLQRESHDSEKEDTPEPKRADA